MRVLFLPTYFYPEGVASSYISWNRNQRFAEEGWEMVVYTPIPCRGISGEQRAEYRKSSHRFDLMLDGKMRVHRFWLPVEKESAVLRAFRYFLQNLKQFNQAAFSRDARTCDIMFVASTPPTQGAMAGLAKIFNRKPLIYNLQDIFPDSLVGTGMTHKGSLLWRIGRAIEDFTYRKADKIIVISEDFKRNIMAKGVPEEKIEVIYNWVDEHAVQPVAKADNPLYEEFRIDPKGFTVVYAGNLGNAQDLGIILSAARLLPDVRFLIFGKGGLESQLRSEIEDTHLGNVRLLPLQPMERVSYVYSLGDVCVVSCKPGLGGSAMPSKTWNIMSCGRPVLASFDEGELKDILEKNDCGIFTHAGNVEEFADAVRRLSKDPEHCGRMGANARKYILENLTREVGTQKYVNVIKQFEKVQP